MLELLRNVKFQPSHSSLWFLSFALFLQSGEEVEGDVDGDADTDEEYDSDEREKMRELISKKLQKEKDAEKTMEPGEEERGKKSSRRYDTVILTFWSSHNSLEL